jgi:hypothetical protein
MDEKGQLNNLHQDSRYGEAATAFAFIVLFTRTSGQIPVRASTLVVFTSLSVRLCCVVGRKKESI